MEKPTIFRFNTSDECYCLCSQVARYLKIKNLQIRYPGLYRRKATPEERRILAQMNLFVKVVPLLLKAEEVEDLMEGRLDKYKGPRKKSLIRKKPSLQYKKHNINRLSRTRKPTVESKPPYTYLMLVGQAFLSSKSGILTASDIFHYISKVYPYYSSKEAPKNWKTTVYNTLSKSAFFERLQCIESTWRIVEEHLSVVRKIALGPTTYNTYDQDITPGTQTSSVAEDDFIMIEDDPIMISGDGRVCSTAVESHSETTWNELRLGGSGTVIIDQCVPRSFEIKEAIESISKQECRTVPADEIIDLVDSDDEEGRVKVEYDVPVASVDLTADKFISCPICDETFTSNAKLGAHVVSHRRSMPPPGPMTNTTMTNTSVIPSLSLDQNNLMVKQTLESLPSALFGQDQKAICIFTGNPNLYFKQ